MTCWGSTAEFELGGGWWVPIPAGPFETIDGFYVTFCGLRPDQTAACWGGNNYGSAWPP